MDKKTSEEQLEITAHFSYKNINKLDTNPAEMETEDTLDLSSSSSVDSGGFGLIPITPEANKESSSSDLTSSSTSPLTLISSSPTTGFYKDNDEDDSSPSTPKDTVFDPFAPGPDKLLLAPFTTKNLQESRSYIERKLNFDSLLTKNDCQNASEISLKDDDDDDMLLLEAVYDSLLECIISKQAADILGVISAVDSSIDEITTPPFASRLIGIADTCPDAPMKPVMKKSRYIDLSLCRKLEFDLQG